MESNSKRHMMASDAIEKWGLDGVRACLDAFEGTLLTDTAPERNLPETAKVRRMFGGTLRMAVSKRGLDALAGSAMGLLEFGWYLRERWEATQKGQERCRDCARCCIPIAFTVEEWERWQGKVQRGYRLIHADGDVIPEGYVIPLTADNMCVFVTVGKRCVIYEQRPATCREYGTQPQTVCPYWGGKEPETVVEVNVPADGKLLEVLSTNEPLAGKGRTLRAGRRNPGRYVVIIRGPLPEIPNGP